MTEYGMNPLFCRYGKAEPEWLLETVLELYAHDAPVTLAKLRRHHSRGRLDRWLPFLLRVGDVTHQAGNYAPAAPLLEAIKTFEERPDA